MHTNPFLYRAGGLHRKALSIPSRRPAISIVLQISPSPSLLQVREGLFILRTKNLAIFWIFLKASPRFSSHWHWLTAYVVSENSDHNCENFEDIDTYFPTVEEITTSARMHYSYSSNATVSECIPIGMDASPLELVMQLGTSKGQYLNYFFSNRLA
jgi:hypothetical protein